MSWILPKGIVRNSPGIEGSIERINTEPLDLADIAKFWKVYTTTKRRLLDPTAERLENYWWRIWGSRKRELNGATVASLFATISNGESFVPLRGPPNRDEGTPPWKRPRPGGSGASSTTALNRQAQNNSRPSTTSSSVSKSAATPHPILKKSRGPSTTGPRPTARFISPHDSGDEPSSEAGENSHVVVQPPSPDGPNPKPEKKSSSGNGGKKTRAVVSAPSSKRPVVFRRKSSHSSTESPSKSVETETGSSGVESSLENPVSPFLDGDGARNKQPSQSKFLENFSPANRLPSPSPNQPETKTSDTKGLSSDRAGSTSRKGAGKASPDSGSSLTMDKRRISEGNLAPPEHRGIQKRRTLPPQLAAGGQLSAIGEPPKRSQSDLFHGSQKPSESRSLRDAGPIRYLSKDVKSMASLAPTLTDATAQLAPSPNPVNARSTSPPKTQDKGKRRASDEAKASKLSPKKSAPPTNGNDGMTRSKSQLELVLEKDRARSGDQKGDGRRN